LNNTRIVGVLYNFHRRFLFCGTCSDQSFFWYLRRFVGSLYFSAAEKTLAFLLSRTFPIVHYLDFQYYRQSLPCVFGPYQSQFPVLCASLIRPFLRDTLSDRSPTFHCGCGPKCLVPFFRLELVSPDLPSGFSFTALRSFPHPPPPPPPKEGGPFSTSD